MCRIAGIFDIEGKIQNQIESITLEIRDSMINGGPDDAGIFVNEKKNISLAHRRLSIIDLTQAGHQPMANENKKIWITFNGEIYNYKELREELSSDFNFKSNSDTEVLIHGYEQWGIEKLLEKIRGMFAFAIYDSRNGIEKLILARDRFGIKPLYYYNSKNFFIFASSVKALLKSNLIPKKINDRSLIQFLQLGSIPHPYTTIENIFSFPIGSYMTIYKNNDKTETKTKSYWNLEDFMSGKNELSEEEAIENTKKYLLDSVEKHMVSDAPLGVFLSGGIDSSALVAIAQEFKADPLKTLSIIFHEKDFNEENHSDLIVNKYNTDHKKVLITKDIFLNELPNIFQAMDEPTTDGINTYFISKAAKETGLKVVLSGLGSDELFFGYSLFKNCLLFKDFEHYPSYIQKTLINTGKLALLPFKKSSVEKLTYLNNYSYENVYLMFRGLFTPKQILQLTELSDKEISILNGCKKNKNILTSTQFFEYNHYLQNQLLKDTDFMSMYHSLEIRVPFVDHVLVKNILKIPDKYKFSNTINKPLLVNALKDKLPEEIYKRNKMGFTFPFDSWIKEEINSFKSEVLESSIFNSGEVSKTWQLFKEDKMHWSRVWALVVASKVFK